MKAESSHIYDDQVEDINCEENIIIIPLVDDMNASDIDLA